MKLPANKWPESDISQSILLFAQLVEEMLSDLTWDSFRAHALETNSRIKEALSLVEEVERGQLPMAALDPVLEELKWSLSSDQVCKHIFDSSQNILRVVFQTQKISSLRNDLNYIFRKLSGTYQETAEKILIEIVRSGGDRDNLRQVCNSYISFLLNNSYSREYILHANRKVFMHDDHQIVRSDKINKFFKYFDNKWDLYDAYVVLKRSTAQLLEHAGVGQSVSLSSVPEFLKKNHPEHFSLEKRQSVVLLPCGKCKDHWKARENAEIVIDFANSYLHQLNSLIIVEDMPLMCIHKRRSKYSQIVDRPSLPLARRPQAPTGTVKKAIRTYTRVIFDEMHDQTSAKTVLSTKLSASARRVRDRDGQLATLWSALEVLMPDPIRTEKGNRIEHYSSKLLPCICFKYVRRLICRTYDGLHNIYGRELLDLVNSLRVDDDFYTQFAALIMTEDFPDQVDQLCNLVRRNPLALNRLNMMHRKLRRYSDIRRFIEAHERRVLWQIFRIYRARNNLAHAGVTQPYHDTIVANLDEYYRCAHGTLIGWDMKRGKHIDRVVNEIHNEYQLYKLYLKDHGDSPLHHFDIRRALNMFSH